MAANPARGERSLRLEPTSQGRSPQQFKRWYCSKTINRRNLMIIWIEDTQKMLSQMEVLLEPPSMLADNPSVEFLTREFDKNLEKWKAHLKLARSHNDIHKEATDVTKQLD